MSANIQPVTANRGGKNRCHGSDGEDIIIKVPEGTIIKEEESGLVIADMSGENERLVLLKGGRGGKGNQHYATATMQAPKYAQPGQKAQELNLILELKVIADVGLVGFPNVGKSTFLARVTNAKPKIANYHFTTLSPNLGVVDLDGSDGLSSQIFRELSKALRKALGWDMSSCVILNVPVSLFILWMQPEWRAATQSMIFI